jgi:hypothetical protein
MTFLGFLQIYCDHPAQGRDGVGWRLIQRAHRRRQRFGTNDNVEIYSVQFGAATMLMVPGSVSFHFSKCGAFQTCNDADFRHNDEPATVGSRSTTS